MDRCGEGEKLVKQPKQVIKINPYFLLHYRIKKKKTVEECGQGNIKFVDCFISFVPRSTSET